MVHCDKFGTEECDCEDRNYEGIPYSEYREDIEHDYMRSVNALSRNYYDNKELENKSEFIWNGINYGVLTKTQYENLQALLFYKMEKELAEVLIENNILTLGEVSDEDMPITLADKIIILNSYILDKENNGYFIDKEIVEEE